MLLGINTGFALNRYPMPSQWLRIIGEELNLKYVQLTADLINPDLGTEITDSLIDEINTHRQKYGITIDSVMTGAFTRVNHFSHPNEKMREHWKGWFRKLTDMSVRVGATNVSSHFGIICYDDLYDKGKLENITDLTINAWKDLAEYGKDKGLKYLSWEPMSIAREYGETIEKTKILMQRLQGSAIPIKLCLDVDHGDVCSSNKDDTDYRKWIKEFARVSPLIHVKQSLEDKGGHYPFIQEYNAKGKIRPWEFIDALRKANALEDTIILLELSFREREPTDSQVLKQLKESAEYWKKVII